MYASACRLVGLLPTSTRTNNSTLPLCQSSRQDGLTHDMALRAIRKTWQVKSRQRAVTSKLHWVTMLQDVQSVHICPYCLPSGQPHHGPSMQGHKDLGFDVDAEVSGAFRLLNAEQAAGLNLRQRLALKAAIQAAATTVPPPGPSSGADSGTSNAAAGLPVCKLQLRRDSQNQDLFFFEPMDTNSTAAAASAGVSSGFFLDPEGRQIDELQKWLGLVEDEHRNGRPIPPLIINGLIKSGKSYMLNKVLPAVANTYYSSGRQHAGTVLSEPNFLHVKCLTLDRWSGSGVFLKGFLIKLKRSAANQQLSAAASTPAPSDNSAGAVVDAIQDFMWRLPRDRLNFLLIDEAQSFYLLELERDDFSLHSLKLDMDEVQLMWRIFKKLLLDSPHWVAWAITGSGMATLWANIAATPTNGFALISHHHRLNLSATVSKDVLQVAWEQLKAQTKRWDPALPSDLVWRSPPQIAMLAYLSRWWSSKWHSTAERLVEHGMIIKFTQVLIDLRMALQVPTDPCMVVPVLGQPTSQVLLLRELLDPMAGVEHAKLPPAFEALLSSFTTERNGRLYLDNLLFAQVLQAATTESGELLEEIIAIPSFSSTMFRELVVLGECCKDENFDSYEDLHSLLEAMASALALTPDKLLKVDWFIQVLDHRYNSHDSKVKFEEDYGAQPDIKVGLRWFHVLLSNILSHAPILEQEEFLRAYPSELAAFHSSGRISAALTKTYEPRRSCDSSSSGTQHGGSSGAQHGGSRDEGRGVMAMADKCTPVCLAPVAGCSQRGPLVHTTGRHGVWGQGGLRAATLAPRLHLMLAAVAPAGGGDYPGLSGAGYLMLLASTALFRLPSR
ncbi:hypothetical protein VOLCADRAFT_103891 [Volvox carteri f. nagariensis]|uniref:Uncharacterized protein n=1 Tax=Volvox carteri f. nagariensis TaxID=3068 RepID=D8TPW5_VOLCA|nr:uncharacterized protein VOLCADRAFT_103891 [Volvox carteri f. nagariensis]EFJ50299.1 hypothetical protein VOLCADRAFT_103891 [Volvox carteri f. nagariensis]|eukprot:XP_002948424.1 hypothetical protein VOLCADRAFT_103891 [Volvox carteri f. nagariensis]